MIKASSVFLLVVIAFAIGASVARFIWADNAKYYEEAKHRYDYCPYCGEYIGSNDR